MERALSFVQRCALPFQGTPGTFRGAALKDLPLGELILTSDDEPDR